MEKLTKRQTEVLECIKQCIDNTGYPPTRAEIARELGFKSANAAEEHLKALARKGAIEMIAGTSRGIRIPDMEQEENLGIPVIGRVAAGSPVLAQEHIAEHCQIPPDFFYPKADYFLKVQGLSMKDVGILDGDLLAVHQTDQAKNGQLVVARIDEEVTVKRFEKNQHQVLLIAENPDFEPIEIDLRQQELHIEGLAVGVLRRGN